MKRWKALPDDCVKQQALQLIQSKCHLANGNGLVCRQLELAELEQLVQLIEASVPKLR